MGKIDAAAAATIRTMLGQGASMVAASKAVGVTQQAISKWVKVEEAAGRTVHRQPPKQGRPATKRPPTPKPAAAPAPAAATQAEVANLLAELEDGPVTVEKVRRVLGHLTVRGNVNAAGKLLDTLRKDGGDDEAAPEWIAEAARYERELAIAHHLSVYPPLEDAS